MSFQNDKYEAFLNQFQKNTDSKFNNNNNENDFTIQFASMAVQQQGARIDKIIDDTIYVTVPTINSKGLYAKEFAENIKRLFNTNKKNNYKIKYRVM